MSSRPRVLVVDDNKLFHLSAKRALSPDCDVTTADHGDEALVLLGAQSFDVILLDVHMRTEGEGLRTLPRIRQLDSEATVLMSSSATDFETVRTAMQQGADDYIPKTGAPAEIRHAVFRALERREMLKRERQRCFEVGAGHRKHVLIGESEPVRGLRRTIEKFRGSQANVLITGETGTGKELVARLMRAETSGGWAPFVAIDSATIQCSTAESVLFGHEKGAFTGADRCVRGAFEEADGGIIYFDEIANMSLDIQAKLLRVLQEKEVLRLGSTRALPLSFRVIAASNQDLERMCREGSFKYDLLQRLDVLPLRLPTLRDRVNDIQLLTNHFIAKHAPGRTLTFRQETIEALQAYPWPGNVRELENVIAYVLAMAEDDEIDVSDLPPKIRDRAIRVPSGQGQGFYGQVAAFERELLSRELEKHEGQVRPMALALGMDRSHLYAKLREHGLRAKSSR